MPIELTWKPEDHLWILSPGRQFTMGDMGPVLARDDWKDARRFLWDLRDLEEGPDATEEIRSAVNDVRRRLETWQGARVAIHVSRDFDFAIARMYQSFADGLGIDYRVFRDRAEAMDWLRMPLSTDGPG